VNKKLNKAQINYAISLHEMGTTKRKIGLIFAETYGVNPTTIYRYLNNKTEKYSCYNITYKEYSRSLQFWQELIRTEIQENGKSTLQLSLELQVPLEFVNKQYINAIKTTSLSGEDFKSNVKLCYH
jgi:hypothetical protein